MLPCAVRNASGISIPWIDGCPDGNDANPLTASGDSDCDGVADDCDVCPGGDDSVDFLNDGIADCSQLLNYNDYSPDWHCDNNKIYVCHNDNNPHTICIDANALLPAHFAHGDKIGPCTSCPQNRIAPANNDLPKAIEMAERTEHREMDASSMTISPNPAGKEVTFHLHGFGDEPTELTLLDYSGKSVWQKTMEEEQLELTLDLSGNAFVSGIYFIKASSADKVLTGRVVISK